MPEKPHKPEPLTSHDPYPADPYADDVDPMAERRARSAGFYAGVDEAIAARPAQPSHITTVTPVAAGLAIHVDDGHGTAIVTATPTLGRLTLGLVTDGRTVYVEVPLGTATVLIDALRGVAGMTPDDAAPITGSR